MRTTDAKATSMSSGAGSTDLLLRKPPREALEWALRAVGAEGGRVSVTPLRGGFSTANHLLRIETDRTDRSTIEVVLRRWVRPGWKQDDPEFSPAQEAATYGLLDGSAVRAPRLLAADPEARACDVPALLLTRVRGERLACPADMRSFVAQLAGALPLVHGIDRERAERTLPPYHPYYERSGLEIPTWGLRPEMWERAIALGTAPPPDETPVFIHRDYHQGNTLWDAGRLTGIVDWTTAMWGPASVDLAHMRANLALSFGLAAADAFVDAYREVVGDSFQLDPYWDIQDAVNLLPQLPFPGQPAQQRVRLEEFVARAVAALGG